MPCSFVRVTYTTKVSLADVDVDILAEAVGLMPEVFYAKVQGNAVEAYIEGRGLVYLDVMKGNVVLTGTYADIIKEKLEQYYAATVQALILRQQGFPSVSVKEQGEVVRVYARN